MRFFHIADTHLGATPDIGFRWSGERKSEIWESFRRMIQKAEQEQLDLLLIAGDLFHRQPLLRELKEVNYLFSTLTKTKVVFIIGNHDFLKKDSYYRGFLWNENVTCLAGEECEKVSFPELQTTVYGLSYHSREIREPLYHGLAPAEDDSYSILLAHGGDEKHIPMDKRRLLDSGFDYIALGHIHKPQILEMNRMIYAGALEPLDHNDTGVHGFIYGSYEAGALKTAFIPWAVREYQVLELEADEQTTDFSMQERIRDLIREKGTQHIYKIRITGIRSPEMIFQTELYGKLGNVIKVIDDSEPAYDFDRLSRQHKEDIIGCYIDRLRSEQMGEMERRALFIGVQALLNAKR